MTTIYRVGTSRCCAEALLAKIFHCIQNGISHVSVDKLRKLHINGNIKLNQFVIF